MPTLRALSMPVAGHRLLSPRHPVFVEPPPRLITPGNITASPGQDVVMSCVVLGDVPYNLTWSWDGRAAQPGDGRTRLLQNHSLEISPVQPGDGGLYECVAQSAHGTATASLWLFIQGRFFIFAPLWDPARGIFCWPGEWHPRAEFCSKPCRGTLGEGGPQSPAFQQGPGAAAELHGQGPPPAPQHLEALGLGPAAG